MVNVFTKGDYKEVVDDHNLTYANRVDGYALHRYVDTICSLISISSHRCMEKHIPKNEHPYVVFTIEDKKLERNA